MDTPDPGVTHPTGAGAMFVLDAAIGRSDAGAKAERLARARALGLLVPDGFVVPAATTAPAQWSEQAGADGAGAIDEAELGAQLGRLGGEWFAVRSSADVEDRPGASAAGVFLSLVPVERASVLEAVARVRASAYGESARAYLGARGIGRARVAVLVQPYVVAERLGVLHTTPRPAEDDGLDEGGRRGPGTVDGRGAILWAEERDPSEPEWGDVTPRSVRADEPLAEGARRLAVLVGGAADVEYALVDGVVVFLQVRPLSAAPEGHDPALWIAALAEGAEAASTDVELERAGGGGPWPGSWVRDAEHNPEPLSSAQASLVRLVSGRWGTARQRVVLGYLFVEDRGVGARDEAPPIPLGELEEAWRDRIKPRCDAALAPLEAEAAARVAHPGAAAAGPGGRRDARASAALLEAALAAFQLVVQCSMGELAPSLRAARRALDELVQRNIGESLAEHGALLAGTGGRTVERDDALWAIGRARSVAAPASLMEPVDRVDGDDQPDRVDRVDRLHRVDRVDRAGQGDATRDERGGTLASLLARYGERFGAYAPAWDVAVAPDDEEPERVLRMARLVARGRSPEVRHHEALAAAAAEGRRVADRLPPSERAGFAALLATVRRVQPIAEDDDAVFFRAQRVVRRALLARGEELTGAGQLDDARAIFEVTLDELARGRLDAASGRARRAQRAAWRKLSPPSRFVNGAPRWRTLAARGRTEGSGARFGAGLLIGAGTSGRAFGRAYRVLDAADAPASLPVGAVLVTAAILPSLTYLIAGAAAVVTDHGGALSHAATLAREYGVPAVLGTGGATAALCDGEELLVDADAGKVYRMGG